MELTLLQAPKPVNGEWVVCYPLNCINNLIDDWEINNVNQLVCNGMWIRLNLKIKSEMTVK